MATFPLPFTPPNPHHTPYPKSTAPLFSFRTEQACQGYKVNTASQDTMRLGTKPHIKAQ